jgi:hypothetical protein
LYRNRAKTQMILWYAKQLHYQDDELTESHRTGRYGSET